MYLTMFDSVSKAAAPGLRIEPDSLYNAFEQVRDGRKKNGGILALMDWLQVSNVASQMRHFCAYPSRALHLLCCKLLR